LLKGKDDIRILIDVVIADLTKVFFQYCATQRFVPFNVAQVKEQNYCDQHLINQNFPLVVEVFECLHEQVDVFLHNCANVI
jgi:hypothetical protein